MFNSQSIMIWSVVAFSVTAFVHIAFSVGVYGDAIKQQEQKPLGTAFVGPFFWAIAVLLGGVFVAGVYWLLHHSSLSKQ